MSIGLVMSSNHLVLCCPPLLLPSIFPSIRVFSNELALCIRWPEYWGFSISPASEYSRLISFKIDASKFFFYRIFYSMLLINLILKRFTTLGELNWFPTRFPCMHAYLVTPSCLTLCNPMDYTVHGILQAIILEWVAFPFSRGSSQPRDGTQVSCIAGRFFS